MQKRKYILVSLCFLGLLAALLIGCDFGRGRIAEEGGHLPERLTLLCAGLDDAVGNTDVLMLISLDSTEKELTVLQIPRDTYFLSHTAQNKINQLYPHYRLEGKTKKESLSALSKTLESAFGITIDAYVAFDLMTVSSVVDELGGVVVDVPTAIRHWASDGDGYVEIPAGRRLLNGREAIEFLRFRTGYLEGDLGRVDAQKLLLAAVYRKLRGEMSISAMLALVSAFHKSIVTEMSGLELVSLARAYYGYREELSVRFVTLPGEATRSEEGRGLSYYVANKKASSEIMRTYFGGEAFDSGERFLDKERVHFMNIYYDNNLSYTVYDEQALDEMDVKIKKK